MDRKHALSTFGAVTVAAGTAALALGISFGAFGLDSSAPKVGKLSPIDTSVPASAVEERTIVVQDPPLPAAAAAPSTPGAPSQARDGSGPDADHTTVATTPPVSSATRVGDDDHGDDDHGDAPEAEVHDDDDD